MNTKRTTTTLTDPETGRTWRIKVLNEGDKYGLNDCLTHDDKDDPIVEFYDMAHVAEALVNFDAGPGHLSEYRAEIEGGQFVTRYYISTLRGYHSPPSAGLDLVGYEPAWKLSGRMMDLVMTWLSKGRMLYVTPVIYFDDVATRFTLREDGRLIKQVCEDRQWRKDAMTGTRGATEALIAMLLDKEGIERCHDCGWRAAEDFDRFDPLCEKCSRAAEMHSAKATR